MLQVVLQPGRVGERRRVDKGGEIRIMGGIGDRERGEMGEGEAKSCLYTHIFFWVGSVGRFGMGGEGRGGGERVLCMLFVLWWVGTRVGEGGGY